MCGIAGIYNGTQTWVPRGDKILTEMMFVSQLRGRDSTGVFLKRKDGQLDYLKMVGPVDEFNRWKDAHDRFHREVDDARFAVAHMRAATIGDAKSMKAAHPHATKNIILVHNGTLRQYDDEKKFPSDSAAIAQYLEDEPDFREAQKRFKGAFALVWYDRRDDSLNFVRNHERPLHFSTSPDGVIYFASEAGTLNWILERNDKVVQTNWQLAPYKWQKVREGKLTEYEVPFSGTGEVKEISMEDFISLPESERAWETIQKAKVAQWADTKVASGPEPKKPTPNPILFLPPAVRREREKEEKEQEAKSKREENRLLITRDNWETRYSHLNKKDSILFIPRKYGISDNNGKKGLVAEGVLLEWGTVLDKKTQKDQSFCLAAPGIIVRSRVKVDDSFAGTIEDYMEEMQKRQLAMDGTITAFNEDHRIFRMVIWAKDAEPQDWFNFEEFCISENELRWAERTPMDFKQLKLAAPEVAANEKKH